MGRSVWSVARCSHCLDYVHDVSNICMHSLCMNCRECAKGTNIKEKHGTFICCYHPESDYCKHPDCIKIVAIKKGEYCDEHQPECPICHKKFQRDEQLNRHLSRTVGCGQIMRDRELARNLEEPDAFDTIDYLCTTCKNLIEECVCHNYQCQTCWK